MAVVERELGGGGVIKKWDDNSAWDDVTVNIKLMTDVAVDGEVIYAAREISFQTRAQGEVPSGHKLVAPAEGAWQYWVKIGTNTPFLCNVEAGDGSALSLADLVALAGVPTNESGTPQWAWLVNLYTEAQGATDDNVAIWNGNTLVDSGVPFGLPSKVAAVDGDIVVGYLHEVDVSGGDVTLNLPGVSGLIAGSVYGFKVSGLNKLILDGDGSELVDSRPTYLLNRHEQAVLLTVTATGWEVAHEYYPHGQPFAVGYSLVGGVDYVS